MFRETTMTETARVGPGFEASEEIDTTERGRLWQAWNQLTAAARSAQRRPFLLKCIPAGYLEREWKLGKTVSPIDQKSSPSLTGVQ